MVYMPFIDSPLIGYIREDDEIDIDVFRFVLDP
jgi:hypothetical protein